MYPKFSFIRRFTEQVQQVVRFAALPVDFEFHVTEEEIIEEIQTRGYGIA